MINNPILQRELKTSFRDPKTIFLLVTFLTILSAVLMFLWPKSGIFPQASDSSMQIFAIFLMSNLSLIILLVPALTSPSITTERENNSYSLLFTSLLSAGEILRGKLFSALAMVLLVVFVSMPISAMCSLSGGIGVALLVKAFLVILVSAVTYGIVGLAISAVCRTTFSALMITYGLVAILAGTTWLPYQLLGRIEQLKVVWLLLRTLSPFDAIYYLLYPTRYDLTQISNLSLNPYLCFLIGNGIVLLIFLLIFCKYVVTSPKPGLFYKWLGYIFVVIFLIIGSITAAFSISYFSSKSGHKTYTVGKGENTKEVKLLRFKQSSKKSAFQNWFPSYLTPNLVLTLLGLLTFSSLMIAYNLIKKGKEIGLHVDQFDDTISTVKRKLSWPFYLIDPLKRKKSIGRFRNPVFIAEMRSKIFARPRFIIYGLFSCIGMSMSLLILASFSFATTIDQDVIRWVAIVFQIGIIAIVAPAIASGAITDEISSRTFLSLRMTPISAIKIVIGKLKASFVYVSIFLISSLPVLFALVYLDYSNEALTEALKESGSDIAFIDKAKILTVAFWRGGVWILILLLSTLTFISAGFCASAFSKSTSTATAISYCFAAFVCIVTLAGLIPDAFTVQTKEFLLQLNPIISALRVTSDELFPDLSENVWINNVKILCGTTLFFLIISSARVYYIFTKRT